jgi:hypothetical protein
MHKGLARAQGGCTCHGEISGIGLLIAQHNWTETFANGLVFVT